MIARLRLRLTLLVIAVLVIVTSGIVFAISYGNYRAVDRRAYAALNTLSRSRERPAEPPEDGTPPPVDADGRAVSDDEAAASPPPVDADGRALGDDAPAEGETPKRAPTPPDGRRTEPPDLDDGFASLSTTYTALLNDDGGVESWSSDRESLYSDAQVQAMADAALAGGRETGRVGTQYYRLWTLDGVRRLTVLDARLEHLAARSVLRTTALVASLACALLSFAAWLLIGRMVKPVQEAFERQKQFVWDASHEFKTPLAVISANAEVLAGEIGKNEYLGYIQSEVKRTDRLVQSLLTLARMDKGTVTAQMARFDLSNALLEVALPFESTVFEAGRTLETDIPEGVFVRGDREMLQQLAVILLSNALKYSDAGGLIRLSLAQKGHGCRISVYNTGPGIATENLERIFDRFYREDLSHSSDVAGNGLGLAIARNIVEAHRGKIHAESEYGKSATFVVTLGG